MSLAPFWIADISTTLQSRTTGASSPCLASASALISCISSRTSTSPGSDLNVARALLDRRHQHDVAKPNDGRILALPRQRLGADLLHLLEDFDIAWVRSECRSRPSGSPTSARRCKAERRAHPRLASPAPRR